MLEKPDFKTPVPIPSPPKPPVPIPSPTKPGPFKFIQIYDSECINN